MKFTVYRLPFTARSQATVFSEPFAKQIQSMKIENCELKIATTEGVA
jgi:hypothetical protein